MEPLENVLWIGGPAGAGKTTCARILARRHGLRWYSSDTQTWEHRERALAAGVELPPRGPGSHLYDRGPMILDDLSGLPAAPMIVGEGGPLPPAMTDGMAAVVWLMPSREVQRARLETRHPDGVPPAYLQGWDRAAEQLEASAVDIITVDHLTVDEAVAAVERVFARQLRDGPKVTDLQSRRDLLRYGNRAILTQCLDPSSVPLVSVSPHENIRPFDCECAAPDCTVILELSVADAAARAAGEPPSIVAACHGVTGRPA